MVPGKPSEIAVAALAKSKRCKRRKKETFGVKETSHSVDFVDQVSNYHITER
jgi:hypothetical protein